MLFLFWVREFRGLRYVSPATAAFVAGITLAAAADTTSPPVGVKRCKALEVQLAELIKARSQTVPARVRDLEMQAENYCAKGKTAEGIRSYAKALNVLGAQPVFPRE